MGNICKYELWGNFGFTRDPFKTVKHETSDGLRIRRILKMAVADHGMISIVGDRGIGKSTAIRGALTDIAATIVVVDSADRERLAIGDVEKEMILALCDENPKAGRVVRSKQLRRVVGEAGRKNQVVVVIEEAHRLHGQTLRSIKTLREMEWMGKRELFTVIFVGQSDPMNKPGVSEVRLRSDSVYMRGLIEAEVRAYINDTMGDLFDGDVIDSIVAMPAARNFMELQKASYCLMGRAATNGRNRVEVEDFAEEFGKGVSKPAKRGKTGKGAKAGTSAMEKVLARREDEHKNLNVV